MCVCVCVCVYRDACILTAVKRKKYVERKREGGVRERERARAIWRERERERERERDTCILRESLTRKKHVMPSDMRLSTSTYVCVLENVFSYYRMRSLT